MHAPKVLRDRTDPHLSLGAHRTNWSRQAYENEFFVERQQEIWLLFRMPNN
jgi:hypothetical protein